MKNLIYIFFIAIAFETFGQIPGVKQWDASWITHPKASVHDEGVFLFRRNFYLKDSPKSFIVHVSADNRYKLYVNGQFACEGPARGDFLKWRYESVDIAKYLQAGDNLIAAKVWDMGDLRPVAQFSKGAGFILQYEGDHANINTNNLWKSYIDSAYKFYPINHLNQYYVTGPGEKYTAGLSPGKWKGVSFNDDTWEPALVLEKGMGLNQFQKYGSLPSYALVPRLIPMMERKTQRFKSIRRIKGIENADNLLTEGNALIIDKGKEVSILIDQGELTNAYPQLTLSGGQASSIKITYAESLFESVQDDTGQIKPGRDKGNRDEVKGKVILGNYDILIPGGQRNITYEPLWWRTFRYVQLDIETGESPLIIHDLKSTFTGYPLQELASFSSTQASLDEIWDVSWRTQRLCAGETFFDCPYYEQLQYAGDTRVQTLIANYVAGDTLLWRRAIMDFYDSRLPMGITQSRYPSHSPQLIPTYSLVWVTMLYDYIMHCEDKEFIRHLLPAASDILQWYAQAVDESGQLGPQYGWNFVDWVEYKGWNSGRPPTDNGKHSAIIGLQYVYTLQKASILFKSFGLYDVAGQYALQAKKTKKAIMENCFDATVGLISDTPEKIYYSQHANVLGILTGVFGEDEEKEVMEKIITDQKLAPCSYYFRFYLTEALLEAGMGNRYVDMLDPWHEMLDMGLTTFVESPEYTRSDCHAWSASPAYHFLSLVCGIRPSDEGFASVQINPHPGSLEKIQGKMPWRNGFIEVDLQKKQYHTLEGELILPEGLKGTFNYFEQTISLREGVNKIH